MNRFLAILCALLALACCAPAAAAISAPTLLTTGSGTSAISHTTASVTIQANALGLVIFAGSSSITVVTVVPSTGADIWTCAPVTTSSGAGRVTVCYTYSAGFTGTLAIATGAISSGVSWVVAYATNSATSSILDKTGTGSFSAATVTGVSPNVTVATLSQADELIVALTLVNGTSGTITDSGPDAFTKLTEDQAGGENLAFFYKVAAAVNGVGTGYSYATTWVNSHAYTAMAWSFKGLGGAAANCSVTTTGAGAC